MRPFRLLALYAAQRCGPDERTSAIDRLLDFYKAAGVTDIERPSFVAVTVLAAATRHDDHVLKLATALFPDFNRRQRWQESLTVNECGVQVARRLGDRAPESYCLARLGVTYRHMDLYEQALTCLNEALAIERNLGDVSGAGNTMNALGATYRQLRQLDKAEECLRSARPLPTYPHRRQESGGSNARTRRRVI